VRSYDKKKAFNMKIFITGADGFIGSHLVEKLVQQGHKVKALALYNDHNRHGWLDYIDNRIKKNVEVILGDIRDSEFLSKNLKGSEVLFHLAALISIPYSYVSPASYVNTNITGSLNVFNAALKNNINQVIHTSTSEVYGTAQKIPINENHPLNGQSPYAASKIGADQLAMSFYYSFNMPVTIVRPFNTYGPRQSQRAVIPTIISQSINVNEIKLGNIKTTRDFSYIDDTVSAFSKCINKKKTFGEVLNLGSNFEIPIKNIVPLVGKILNKKIKVKFQKSRKRPSNSEVYRLMASNKKAKHLLNWTPKYAGTSGFKKGLRETVKWFEKNHKKLNFKSKIYNL